MGLAIVAALPAFEAMLWCQGLLGGNGFRTGPAVTWSGMVNRCWTRPGTRTGAGNGETYTAAYLGDTAALTQTFGGIAFS